MKKNYFLLVLIALFAMIVNCPLEEEDGTTFVGTWEQTGVQTLVIKNDYTFDFYYDNGSGNTSGKIEVDETAKRITFIYNNELDDKSFHYYMSCDGKVFIIYTTTLDDGITYIKK